MMRKTVALFYMAAAIALGMTINPPMGMAQAAKGEIADIADRAVTRIQKMLGKNFDAGQLLKAYAALKEAEQSFTPEQKEELLKALKDGAQSAEKAEKIFDDLIARMEKTMSLGDPNGEFVQLLNKVQKRLLERAEKAKQRKTKVAQQLAKGFLEMANQFAAIRDRAMAARDDAREALEFIKNNRADYIDAIALQNFAVMAEIAEEAVSKMEKQSQKIRESARLLGSALGQNAMDE